MDSKTFDKLVEEWHTSDSKLQIHEFMGISLQEYSAHVEQNHNRVYYIKTEKMTSSEAKKHLKEQMKKLNRPFSITGSTRIS